MAKNNEKIKALLKRAEEGTREVFESENYRNYLTIMSKFHNYSYRNNLLILAQRPDATHVAGYSAWQKKFNRHVRRGEKGIQIIGYAPKKISIEEKKTDQDGNPVIGADGKPVTETSSVLVPSFIPVYVYDLSQTEGEPLPELVHDLNDNVDAYQELMDAIISVSPFPITFENFPGEARGYCDPVAQKIVIREGMSESQSVKTAIHEITHADLHAPQIDTTERPDRRTSEVEAESTAFVVCSHYGIDTSDYTFPYLASWSSTRELKELQNSLEKIQKQAEDLIDRIDTRLEEIHKEREKALSNDEVEQYDFDNSKSDILPLDSAKAKELFAAGATIQSLYFDNSYSPIKNDVMLEKQIEKNGLFGIKSGDWSQLQQLNQSVKDLTTRLDALAKELGTTDPPFDLPDESRIPMMQDIVQKLEYSYIVHTIEQSLPKDDTEHSKQLDQIKKDIDTFQQEQLFFELKKCGGEPIVYIRWSENPALTSGQILPLHLANKLFERLDMNYPKDQGYDKTSFLIKYMQNGECMTYEGRQDFGDREGSLINHIRNFWEYELQDERKALHTAYGNTSIIDHATEAVEQFVPYLSFHANLGELEDQIRTDFGELNFMLDMGINPSYSTQRKLYFEDMLSYITDCRIALNTGSELPTMPDRSTYLENAKVDAAYRQQVEEEITAEAKAAGITPDQYVAAGSIAPANRIFTIYQLNDSPAAKEIRFMDIDYLEQKNITPTLALYNKVYSGVLPKGKGLDDIFMEFNINRPADFTGHNLSVSDVVAIEYQGSVTANYIDSFGFKNLPDLAAEIQKSTEAQRIDQKQTSEESIVGIISFHNGETQEFTDSSSFIATIKEELPYRSTSGFQFKVITTDAFTRKAVDDLIYDEYGEDNPRTLEDYQAQQTSPKKISMKDRLSVAKSEADRRNVSLPDKKNERGDNHVQR